MGQLKAAARRREITRMLEEQGAVSVSELTDHFNVSAMTIRRDLAALSESGIVSRSGGGATLKHGSLFELDISQKMRAQVSQKRAIGKAGATEVEDGSSVFIDCGTTPAAVARELVHHQDLTVFTNSLLAASVLSKAPHLQLIMCPGEYRPRTMGFLGQTTIEFMKNFKVDIAFMGAEGISGTVGMSVPDADDCITKREMLDVARKVVFVADSTKFGQEWLCSICPLEDVDAIVTDCGITEQSLEECRGHQVQVKAVCAQDTRLQQ